MADATKIPAVRALGLTIVAIAVTWFALSALAASYAAFAPATCLGTHCFCETPRFGSVMLQPANSWSSFTMVFTGFLIMFDAAARRGTTAFPADAAIVFGGADVVIGVGSVLLHATLTLWGQFADVLGMYLLSGFMLTYAIVRAMGLERRAAILIYIGVCAVLIAVLAAMPEVRRWLFFVVLITALTIEIGFARPRRPGVIVRFLWLGILVKAIAFTIWILDQQRLVCAPGSLLQGHAVWHILGALSVWLTYSYYRSERPAA